MVSQTIGIVTIGAKDITRLRTFYKELGWIETSRSTENYSVFKMGGVFFALFPMDELFHDAGLSEGQVEPRSFKGVAFTITVENQEDVDQMIDKVREVGGKIIKEPQMAFWGGRMGYFMDPEENVWEIAWIPSATFIDGIMTHY